MTRVEAIAILGGFKYNPLFNDQQIEAFDMAISALEKNESAGEWYKLLCEKWDSAENKGEWVFDETLDKHYYCSECKSMGVSYWDYCPYCGARMKGGE